MARAATGQVPGSVQAEIDEVKQSQGFGQGERGGSGLYVPLS